MPNLDDLKSKLRRRLRHLVHMGRLTQDEAIVRYRQDRDLLYRHQKGEASEDEMEEFEGYWAGMGGASGHRPTSLPILDPQDEPANPSPAPQPKLETSTSDGVGRPLYDPVREAERIDDPAVRPIWWPKPVPERRVPETPALEQSISHFQGFLAWLLG